MIRLLRESDIAACMRLKQAAGWNQTEQDWANVMALEPEGCWLWDEDGQVVATTTAVCYGAELAWIGMVLVLPEFRGRGLARRLMEHALTWLDARRVQQVKLDATDMGRPLYASLGFRDERAIERWGIAWDRPARFRPASLPAAEMAAFDRECFGADRSRLIWRLLAVYPGQGSWRQGEGFALTRPGSNAHLLGPCQATSPGAAGELLRGLLDRTAAPAFFWDLCPDQPAAVELARELGFERKRELVRMALGPEAAVAGRPERVFGAAGFEYG